MVNTELIAEVEQINKMRTKQPHWKWHHLPSSTDPHTGIRVFHYQGCKYEYKEGETKILEPEDIHQLIALTFCKVYLTRFSTLTLIYAELSCRLVLGALEAMATLYGDLEVCADAVAFRWQWLGSTLVGFDWLDGLDPRLQIVLRHSMVSRVRIFLSDASAGSTQSSLLSDDVYEGKQTQQAS